MRSVTAGFTLVEGLIAMVLFALLLSFSVPMLTGSIGSNAKARVRTSLTSVAESWLDRYRSGQEPLDVGGPCSGSSASLTCTYAAGYNYASDGIASHAADASAMSSRFGNYNSTIQATLVNGAGSTNLWEIKATVTAKAGSVGGDKLAVLTTRLTK